MALEDSQGGTGGLPGWHWGTYTHDDSQEEDTHAATLAAYTVVQVATLAAYTVARKVERRVAMRRSRGQGMERGPWSRAGLVGE